MRYKGARKESIRSGTAGKPAGEAAVVGKRDKRKDRPRSNLSDEQSDAVKTLSP